MPSIIKVDQIQSDQGFVNVSSNLQFSSGFTMLSPTLSSPTLTTPTTSGILTLGAGIQFPATQVSSADANTLDDYEEGSWTPTLGGSSSDPSGVTHDGRMGYYTKIGRKVTVSFWIGWTTYTGGSGTLLIRGLPFAPLSDAYYYIPGVALTERLVFFSSSYTYPVVRALSTFTHMDVMEGGSNVGWRGMQHGTATTSSSTGKYVAGSVTYFV